MDETTRNDTAQATAVVEGLTDLVEAVAPHADTPAELLGLTVGRAYGLALAERDQAREVVSQVGQHLAAAVAHLEAVLKVVPDPPTFAQDADTVAAARVFLADLADAHAVD